MQHEAHPGLPDYGEVSSRERALEQYAQDLHRREIQLMRDRIHKKPVGGGPTLGNAPGRRAAGGAHLGDEASVAKGFPYMIQAPYNKKSDKCEGGDLDKPWSLQ